MDIALLSSSIAILVWMCAQFALLTRRQHVVVEEASERSGAGAGATASAPKQLAVVEHAPSLD